MRNRMKALLKDRHARTTESRVSPDENAQHAAGFAHFDLKAGASLTVLLAIFLLLQCFVPLRTAIQIGPDEGFELAKATLCLGGHKLYSDVWNDQPPLHTFFITQILKHVSPSILGPRLLTSVFALILLASTFIVILRFSGLSTAALATALVIVSPAFLELGSSCMLEIPALAPAVAALAVLAWGRNTKWRRMEVVAGALFGAGLAMKLVPVILLPVAALIVWLNLPRVPSSIVGAFKALLALFASMAVSFVAIDWLVDDGAFLSHIRQTWVSHFAATKTFEYGSPADHPMDWMILLRNWDTTVPAAGGLIFLLVKSRRNVGCLLPVLWLGLMLGIFLIHRPWWSYYYVHLAIPLCWCASVALIAVCQRMSSLPRRSIWALLAVYILAAWMTVRVFLQIRTVSDGPRTYSSPLLELIGRFKPFTQWIYTEEPVFSFHSGIPLPPDLGVVMLKRFWSGEMTNAKIEAELRTFQPGVILLMSNTGQRAFENLLATEYRMIYQDGSYRLYVRNSIANKVVL